MSVRSFVCVSISRPRRLQGQDRKREAESGRSGQQIAVSLQLKSLQETGLKAVIFRRRRHRFGRSLHL